MAWQQKDAEILSISTKASNDEFVISTMQKKRAKSLRNG
jgi:hypothetical protein